MSSYKGLSVSRLSDGTIVDVQVEESNGISLCLTPAVYKERGIQPPIQSLPDSNDPTSAQATPANKE
jgi:hypothetical protein